MISFKKFRKTNDQKWAGKDRKILVQYALQKFDQSKEKKDGWELLHIRNPERSVKKYAGNVELEIGKNGQERVIKV